MDQKKWLKWIFKPFFLLFCILSKRKAPLMLEWLIFLCKCYYGNYVLMYCFMKTFLCNVYKTHTNLLRKCQSESHVQMCSSYRGHDLSGCVSLYSPSPWWMTAELIPHLIPSADWQTDGVCRQTGLYRRKRAGFTTQDGSSDTQAKDLNFRKFSLAAHCAVI